MLILKAKPGVNWDVCPAIEKAQPILAKAWDEKKATATITSARDGEHSKKTAHTDGRAIDLRITNLFLDMPIAAGARPWFEKLIDFCMDLDKALVKANLGGDFYLVLESNHIHLEWVDKDVRPNIIDWKQGTRVYVDASVKKYLTPEASGNETL